MRAILRDYCTLLIFAAIFLVSRSIPQENIRFFMAGLGILGPVVFVFLMMLTYIIAPVSASPLLFAGFYLFGRDVVIYSVAAAFISSIINFWIAKIWGRSPVEKFVGRKNIERLDKVTVDYGLQALFLIRVFQGGLFFCFLCSRAYTDEILALPFGINSRDGSGQYIMVHRCRIY